jgi:tRNA G18 (ribose-2'-O)-methylase SpoU
VHIAIASPLDSRLDDYRDIPAADRVHRRGLFVAEGRLVVERLLVHSPLVARSVLLTEAAQAALAPVLATRPELPVYLVPQTVMDTVAGFNVHRGCLALGERPQPRRWQETVTRARTVVVLERIANADNIGSLFRSAAAFGADAVLLDPVATDPLYRKAIRTSMGATLVVPFARAEPWPSALHELRALGFATLALTPAASAPTIHEVAPRVGPQPVALVLGHEGEGLSDAALEACDLRARIPTSSLVDSLNVATAGAIALYECRREGE